ncbi:MAG: aldehyde dehydrogenase (NADP(+)) [Fimbriimonadaceae bacterium]
MALTGLSFLGNTRGATGGKTFRASHRAVGDLIEPDFHSSTLNDVDQVCALALDAFGTFRKLSGSDRASFLTEIARSMERVREEIVERYVIETGLPEARANNEFNRTIGQVRLFANVAEEGTWADPRIETALPDRQPLPKPDMRSLWIPLGPVAVFGASNFPLAYSVMGGDSASALAAGCPIIVKAHPAHPGVSELVANCVIEAAESTGMPEGVFSMLFDSGFEVGQALVCDPRIKGVGFTGSQKGGLALWRLAMARSEPIPVYAEMGSVNPSVILHGKLADPEAMAKTMHGSLTMGMGQFCTKPGLIITVGNADSFIKHLEVLFESTPFGTMLTDGIESAYNENVQARASAKKSQATVGGTPRSATLFTCDAATFIAQPELGEEIFGPAAIIVTCPNESTAEKLISGLEGQLTGSIHGTEADLDTAGQVFDALEQRVGRLLVNQVPTGLEVCSATVHGGPFPSTTEPRSTSVGTMAIQRWARPICYQNVPQSLLPRALRTD